MYSVDFKRTFSSPANKSTAKAQWSFPKSKRFSQQKKLCDSFYEIPQTKSNRKTSFGYGKKIDLDFGKDKSHVVPPPTNYAPPDFVQINKKAGKGFSPGKGRQETKSQSFFKLDEGIPGPGAYQTTKIRDLPLYTLRPKTASEVFVNKESLYKPGPGTYSSTDEINNIGRYSNSKFQSSRSKSFDPKSSSRFKKQKSEVPGPGNYTPKNDFSLDGSYILSNNQSKGKRIFGRASRSTFVEDQIKKNKDKVGPGNYQLPSDFGIYQLLDLSMLNKSGYRGSTSRRT